MFIVASYLLGSLPHLPLLGKLRHVQLDGDFHQELWRKAGKLIGALGVLGEFTKGILPVLVAKAIHFNLLIVAMAGLAAVSGQMWSVFTNFDGEKGNSIGLAMAMALAPLIVLIGLIPVIIALVIRTMPRLVAKAEGKKPLFGGAYSKSLPLGMLVCFLILPFIAWCRDEPWETVGCLGLLFTLIMVRRLTAGLRGDLKTDEDIKAILLRRLLYDRATVEWRQK